jgi:hypothetical protein
MTDQSSVPATPPVTLESLAASLGLPPEIPINWRMIAVAACDRLKAAEAERDYCRKRWRDAYIGYLVYGHNFPNQAAVAEVEPRITTALRTFRQANGMGGGG